MPAADKEKAANKFLNLAFKFAASEIFIRYPRGNVKWIAEDTNIWFLEDKIAGFWNKRSDGDINLRKISM